MNCRINLRIIDLIVYCATIFIYSTLLFFFCMYLTIEFWMYKNFVFLTKILISRLTEQTQTYDSCLYKIHLNFFYIFAKKRFFPRSIVCVLFGKTRLITSHQLRNQFWLNAVTYGSMRYYKMQVKELAAFRTFRFFKKKKNWCINLLLANQIKLKNSTYLFE